VEEDVSVVASNREFTGENVRIEHFGDMLLLPLVSYLKSSDA
jgi:hypothetical protein